MKTALIVALVLGSSSVALADTSYSVRGQVSFGSFGNGGAVVRDYRTPARQPVYSTTSDGYRGEYRPYYPAPRPHYPAPRPVVPAGLDCRNWDPTVEVDSPCAAYGTGLTYAPRAQRGWDLLGVRESSVATNQFVTVADGRWFAQLKLRAEAGSPVISKVAVRFMDNSTQVINVGGRLDDRSSLALSLHRKPVNQIVVYTANGSFGSYSISAH